MTSLLLTKNLWWYHISAFIIDIWNFLSSSITSSINSFDMLSRLLCLTILVGLPASINSFSYLDPAFDPASQYQKSISFQSESDRDFGINDPYIPTPSHILPEKKPFTFDREKNYYHRFINGSENGIYRRSSCPAINTLANRGFINRNGRNITYSQLAHAVREVWNFGDDNVTTHVPCLYQS